MAEQSVSDCYATGAVLQFLARHSDIHYDRSAISLASRLGYADTTAALERLVEWGLVDGRQATIGVRVFGLQPADSRPESGAGGRRLALVIDADRAAGLALAGCLEEAGWRVAAVPEPAKGAFIVNRVGPALALVDSFAEAGQVPWARLAALNLTGGRTRAFMLTGREEFDESLAREYGFAGVLPKPVDRAFLIALAGRSTGPVLAKE